MRAIMTLLVAILAGCTSGTSQPVPTPTQVYVGAGINTYSFWTTTIDGRRIPCVWATNGGLSCDWTMR